MLRRAINCTKYGIQSHIRNQSTLVNAENKWDLFVGVQIERLPIITKTLNKLEQEYRVNEIDKYNEIYLNDQFPQMISIN